MQPVVHLSNSLQLSGHRVLGYCVGNTLHIFSHWPLFCSWKPWLVATLPSEGSSRGHVVFFCYGEMCLGDHTYDYETLPFIAVNIIGVYVNCTCNCTGTVGTDATFHIKPDTLRLIS